MFASRYIVFSSHTFQTSKGTKYLIIHLILRHDQFLDIRSLHKVVVIRGATLGLGLGCTCDEAAHHAVFSPMYFMGLVRIYICIAFVGANEVRHVDFSV
jgi:hypothetical protein